MDYHDGPSAAELEEDETLLQWATRQQQSPSSLEETVLGANATQLVVGVKSAVLSGFPSRQLIRQTWADPAQLPHGVRVLFLGCEPTWPQTMSPSERTKRRDAVALEKAVFQDLLTHELNCHDSYETLVDKIKGFFKWTADATAATVASSQARSKAALVMLVDDDVYVRVPMLLAKLQQSNVRHPFYAGQVQSTQFGVRMTFEREPRAKNFVPWSEYPLRFKPDFATGAHYVLSMDLVQFLARNHAILKGVGTLEDVSVAYWLLSLRQIQARHLVEFDNVRFTLCHNTLLAYGDLSAHAMRRIDTNVRANRSFCDGFAFTTWDKRTPSVTSASANLPQLPPLPDAVATGLSPLRVERQLAHHWLLLWDPSSRVLSIENTVTIVGADFFRVKYRVISE